MTVLSTESPSLFDAAVAQAAELLRAGEVVALPTETVYGLAANALDAAAVRKIYQIKERPAHNPIIVHVTGIPMARECASEWPEMAERLARSFWPGPLTVVVPRAAAIPLEITAGGETVAIRAPSHPFMQAVIRACGFPLAAPSANLANQLSPTNAGHVRENIGARIPLIVDGGQCQVGIESTVIDVTVSPPHLLRPGMIHEESLLAVTSRLQTGASAGALRSPGMLKKHYAPKARLAVVSWRDDNDLQQKIEALVPAGAVFIIAHTTIPAWKQPAQVSLIPHDAEAFARAIYSELHRCDAAGADLIVVEAVPETAEWRGIADRLARAAG